MRCDDIEQLFSNLPHELIMRQMEFLLKHIWNMMAVKAAGQRFQRTIETDWDKMVIIAPKEKTKPARWEQVGRQRSTTKQEVFTPTKLLEWLGIALDNSYMSCGVMVLLQVLGIPMGMNASPFISNLFLFAYEFQFMLQFLQSRAEYKLFTRWFTHMCRFQDDRWIGMSKMVERAISNGSFFSLEQPGQRSQQSAIWKYRGIYPTDKLNITLEQESNESATPQRPTSVQHQDVLITMYVVNGKQMFRVAPYQRKEDPKYDKLKEFIVHYNHADTFLPEACVYGVVYSAAQRFARHASWASEWQVNMEQMLHHMFQLDYDWDKTWAWLRKFIAKFTTLELWGDAKDGAWVRFKAMQKAMHKYRPAMDQQDEGGGKRQRRQ